MFTHTFMTDPGYGSFFSSSLSLSQLSFGVGGGMDPMTVTASAARSVIAAARIAIVPIAPAVSNDLRVIYIKSNIYIYIY